MNARLGFIGVGAMGAPMAERLLAAGHSLVIFDPSAAAMAPLLARGAQAASSALAVASQAPIVFACLPTPAVSQLVALGDAANAGVVDAPGLQLYIECSTIGTACIKTIASGLQQRGIAVLDAPVSGGPRGARAGTLATMVAGAAAAFEQAAPLLAAIAKNVFYVGAEPGLGQMTKLANNMISAAGMAAASEAMVLGVKAGVAPHTLLAAINASTGRNTATSDKFPQSVLTRSFDYGGKFSTMYKDIRLCLDEARGHDIPMWVGSAVVQLWFQGMLEGRGNDDYTTITRMLEEWTGVEIDGRQQPS